MSVVQVLALGGTISMTGTGGVVPTLTGDQLLASVPGLPETGIEVRAEQVRQLPGAALGLPDVLAVLDAARAAVAGGADGVVVVQGTDTIEESGYLLDLLYDGPAPVVVTGAMRNPTQAGADGPANLLAAVRVAADPAARGLGALVVLSDEIHAAGRVRKRHAASPGAFGSPDTGPVGYVAEGRVHVLARPVRGPRPAVPARREPVPVVPLYPVGLGDDGTALEAVAERAAGLVLAGFGVGHVPPDLVPVLARIAARIPVVLVSRTGAGPVHTGSYGFTGSERSLLAAGLLCGGWLGGYQARLLLQVLLLGGADRDAVAAAVGAAGGVTGPTA